MQPGGFPCELLVGGAAAFRAVEQGGWNEAVLLVFPLGRKRRELAPGMELGCFLLVCGFRDKPISAAPWVVSDQP